MNKFLNENQLEIFKELKPDLESGLAQVFISIANQVFSKIPANEIDLK